MKRWIWIVGLILAVLVVVGAFFFMAAFPRSSGEQIVLENPAADLSVEDAIEAFDEEFVYYLLYSIGAQDLRSPPLSDNKPKIEMRIDDDIYSILVDRGEVILSEGDSFEDDLVIITSKEEAVNMMKYQGYIQESFSTGKSSAELKASKSELFAKGYLGVYTKLTGKSITGNVVRIYAS